MSALIAQHYKGWPGQLINQSTSERCRHKVHVRPRLGCAAPVVAPSSAEGEPSAHRLCAAPWPMAMLAAHLRVISLVREPVARMLSEFSHAHPIPGMVPKP